MKKKYEDVIRHIEKMVDSKRLRQGERLPSIREMAALLRFNKATVIRAYNELVMQHRAYTIPKSGYYLVEKTRINSNTLPFIDFYEAVPDPKLLPYREFTHCINRAVELYKDNLFLCTDAQGIKSLRMVLQQYFSEQQVFTSEENIYITSGSQQAFNILSTMLFPNKKTRILIEQPTYQLMQEMLILNGNRSIGIKRDFEGVDLKELERIFKEEDIKFFYTMSRFQNPLGTSYTEKEKMQIVRLAAKYDVYVVEDDYFMDIETNSKILPMHYYDTSGKVVYIRSFSKTFMPGLRLGAAVLPEKLKNGFMDHKRCQDQSTSVLSQGALEIFISSGMYKNHIRKIRTEYGKKMLCMRECLKTLSLTGLEYYVQQTGFFVWIKLPAAFDAAVLEKRLKERQVRIRTCKDFYSVMPPSENSVRIAMSNLSTDVIRRGMRAVVEEINRFNEFSV